jgi:hypothetical protein
VIAELRRRDPLLFWTGAGMLLTLVVCLLISIGDPRLILGLNPWIKPMKFLISITFFLWTVAWFMPETGPYPRARAIVRWTIATAMTVEIICIIMQSIRGTTSHFNHETVFDDAVFSIMGMGVVFNTLAMTLFLWIVRRDTPPSRAGYIWGIRLGVAMFLLASLQGTLIVGNDAHSVPGPDGGPGLPFVNWSTTSGDLRIAHFVGMHAFQGLPLLGFVLDRARVSAARNVVVAAGILWLAVMGGLLMMALQGRPLLSL